MRPTYPSSMSGSGLYVGFDLGTTNSAAAVFDGERAEIVRNSSGAPLTPSIVRVDAKGRWTTGLRALRGLERDPDNTAAEFKRLMGTDRGLLFPALGQTLQPPELAAKILASLCSDVEAQHGIRPTKAVISVPALFELPQSAATREAARLAGLDEVQLIAEPIASALAAGWRANVSEGNWLVYDLGGGTFDASVLESHEGFLRVVGHDGDNFLGGRDIDWAIVDWAIGELAKSGFTISRADPSHAGAIKVLKRAAEEAKIELSRAETALLVCDHALEVPGEELIDVELELSIQRLEQLCLELVNRSVSVCQRLLEEHNIASASLARIVFVGGPTMMPFVRTRVGEALGAPIADRLDPMTLVARGAAIYAATTGLDARPVGALAVVGRRLVLQHPTVSSDLKPHVVGRVLQREDGPALHRIELTRTDGWRAPEALLDTEGAFIAQVELLPSKSNTFAISAFGAEHQPISVHPAELTIVQGTTIADPPLSRSIGVALSNDAVHVYFDKGTPLPARRTFTHETIEAVAKGSTERALKIPIVQGEHERAHLCRLVGTLEIPGDQLQGTLPSGSKVEVTLDVDRGGTLSARALVPSLEQLFEQVAHLLVEKVDSEVLGTHLSTLTTASMSSEPRRFGIRGQVCSRRWNAQTLSLPRPSATFKLCSVVTKTRGNVPGATCSSSTPRSSALSKRAAGQSSSRRSCKP